MKTEVYSWRVATELKTGLEREARRRKTSVSAVLDQAAREWLRKSSAKDEDREQSNLHKTAAKCFGAIASGDPHRSENARKAVQDHLRKQYDR
jgi:hypothetical protein